MSRGGLMGNLLVGVTGKKGSGKDTFGNVAVARGYHKVAFGDAVRREVFLALRDKEYPGDVPWLDSYDAFLDYFEAHKYADPNTQEGSIRLLAQAWAMMQREIHGDDYWIKQVDLTPGTIVCDLRFPKEAQSIWERGGVVVRVYRPRAVAAIGANGRLIHRDEHVSEVAMDEISPDLTVFNVGGLETYGAQVIEALDWLEARKAEGEVADDG
jgi:hypothetical protein